MEHLTELSEKELQEVDGGFVLLAIGFAIGVAAGAAGAVAGYKLAQCMMEK